jgi:hypothetical protein
VCVCISNLGRRMLFSRKTDSRELARTEMGN